MSGGLASTGKWQQNGGVSLPEIPSAWDLLNFQQVGDRLLANDDLVGQRSPGNLYVGTAVSLGTGIRALSALATGDGHAAIATVSDLGLSLRALDAIAFRPIPEPPTMALFLGAGVLGVLARRLK